MTDPVLDSSVEVLGLDIEAALNPVEAEGVHRDTTRSSALLLLAGALLLSPPAPRPKKN